MFVHISFRFPVIFQDSSSPEDLHPKQALKISQLPIFPSAPFLLFLHQVTSSHPFILLPRESWAHPFCRRQWAAAGRVRRGRHRDFLHLLAQWARWMDSLCNIEVIKLSDDIVVISIPFSARKGLAIPRLSQSSLQPLSCLGEGKTTAQTVGK